MFTRPSASFENFKEICSAAVKEFRDNLLIKKINEGNFSIKDYHLFLVTIFHQTYMVPPTMALAGALCPEKHTEIKRYLIKHAEEEIDHWKWALADLQNTGYQGPDPRTLMPSAACTQFISLSYFLACKHPVARLGLPAVLEGVSATYAGASGQKVQKILGLKPDQLVFAFGHGEADVGHTKDILDVLEQSKLDNEDWKWLCYAAQMTAKFYKNMFDEIGQGNAE